MKLFTRAALATCVAVAVVAAWPVAASADSASEAASSGAYFWRGTPPRPDQLPTNPPPVQGNADGVEAGKLAVAAAGNDDDKVSFLFFSLTALPAGSTITKATLTVPLASGAANTTYGAAPEKVWACPAGPQGFGGEDAGALADAPERLCPTVSVGAKASADGKAYEFDVSKIAVLWSTANDGLALTAADGAKTTPFQVVFDSADKATLAYEFTPPADVAPAASAGVPEPTTAAPADTAPVGTGTGGPVNSGTGTASAPADLTAVAAPAAAPLDVPVAAAPAASAPAPAVAGARRTAAVDPAGVLRPTVPFWLAALGLGVTLVALSLVLGAGRNARPAASAAPTLLSRALDARTRVTPLSRPV